MLENFLQDAIFPGALLQVRQSMALLSSSSVGGLDIKLLLDWLARQSIKGSVCGSVLGQVQLEVVLYPTLQLLALVSNELAIPCFKRGCFDAHWAGGCFDPLIHPHGMATVGC